MAFEIRKIRSPQGRLKLAREHLDAVAAELNSRPRKTLGWETPAERLSTLLTEVPP